MTGGEGLTGVNPVKLPLRRKWHGEPVEGQPETMVLALAVWLCTLPLVGLFALPFFGLKVAGLIALGLLFVALTACRLICVWPELTGPSGHASFLDLEASQHQGTEVRTRGESDVE